jgi:hypothetical protein
MNVVDFLVDFFTMSSAMREISVLYPLKILFRKTLARKEMN